MSHSPSVSEATSPSSVVKTTLFPSEEACWNTAVISALPHSVAAQEASPAETSVVLSVVRSRT